MLTFLQHRKYILINDQSSIKSAIKIWSNAMITNDEHVPKHEKEGLIKKQRLNNAVRLFLIQWNFLTEYINYTTFFSPFYFCVR